MPLFPFGTLGFVGGCVLCQCVDMVLACVLVNWCGLMGLYYLMVGYIFGLSVSKVCGLDMLGNLFPLKCLAGWCVWCS